MAMLVEYNVNLCDTMTIAESSNIESDIINTKLEYMNLDDEQPLLRDLTRNEHQQRRKNKRRESFNRGRPDIQESIEGGQFLPFEMMGMALVLKKKVGLNINMMKRLRIGMCQSTANRNAFIKVDGGLHALIGQLSGPDTRFQVESIYTVANLCKEESNYLKRVVKMAGPYLSSYLGNTSSVVQMACAWAIGNMCSLSQPSCAYFRAQGFVICLLKIIKDTKGVKNLTHSAIYALCHYIKTDFDRVTPEELNSVVRCVFLPSPDVAAVPQYSWLLFLLSCSPVCDYYLLNSRAIKWLMDEIQKELPVDECVTTCYIRAIANLVTCSESAALDVLYYANCGGILSRLLNNSHLHVRRSTLLLVANLANFPSEGIQQLIVDINLTPQLWPRVSLTLDRVVGMDSRRLMTDF